MKRCDATRRGRNKGIGHRIPNNARARKGDKPDACLAHTHETHAGMPPFTRSYHLVPPSQVSSFCLHRTPLHLQLSVYPRTPVTKFCRHHHRTLIIPSTPRVRPREQKGSPQPPHTHARATHQRTHTHRHTNTRTRKMHEHPHADLERGVGRRCHGKVLVRERADAKHLRACAIEGGSDVAGVKSPGDGKAALSPRKSGTTVAHSHVTYFTDFTQ
jgi:hypothetical protein